MKKSGLVIALAACFMLLMTSCVTVVKTGEEHLLTGDVAFNAGDNVAAIWDSQALPLLREKAVDITQFLQEAQEDLTSLAEQYGRYSMGDSGELSYVVQGTVTVTEVVTDKMAGYMEVAIDGYTGDQEIKLQIGSVYKGSAVRDSLEFIRFEDYKNQVDYAAVSQSIHDLIQETVIDPIDLSALQGQRVEFTGCFTVQDKDEILITPVQLQVA